MNAPIRFEDHVGLVHFQAKRGFRWAQFAGVAMSYDDMFQEASVAFLIAAKSFEQGRGIAFSTFYTQVAFSEFRRSIGFMSGVKNLNAGQRAQIADRNAENERRAACALAPLPNCRFGLDPTSLSEPAHYGDDGVDDLTATLEGDDGSPEQALEARQRLDAALGHLSPLARLLAAWLVDPPAPLLREVACQRAYAERCTELGVRARGWREGVTLGAVVKFLRLVADLPGAALARAERELTRAMAQLENCHE